MPPGLETSIVGNANAPAETGATPGAVGGAFGVQDGLLALRWAEIVRARGYRLTFSHAFVEAEEALEIWRLPRKCAVATVFRGVRWVWVIDAAGSVAAFADLADALCSVTALSAAERQVMASAETPGWLWQACRTPPISPARRLFTILSQRPAAWRRGVSGRVGRLRLALTRRRT